MARPLIQLNRISREFVTGEGIIQVLKNINLTICAGEMVAIMGSSGSGKSTLMNILGCLDKPSHGEYIIGDRMTHQLSFNELAELRREHFGFIFQRYHLLNALTAEGNVEIPAIYAGIQVEQRKKTATELLTRLGLDNKIKNKPTQLSGGQQQRVSIARALMNGGQIILADEPTGALDQKSGQEVMAILQHLHQKGHTIILVTHDPKIAKAAERIIEISDGQIISDKPNPVFNNPFNPQEKLILTTKKNDNVMVRYARFIDAFNMAMLSMSAQKLRTFLTMLGIIIGIASVVSVVALGEGSQKKILSEISGMGTSTLEIFPGSGFGDQNAYKITTLRALDADALANQNYIHSATPNISVSLNLRSGNKTLSAFVNGVGEQFFVVRGYKIIEGRSFTHLALRNSTQEAIIDKNTAMRLFPNQAVIGKSLLVGHLPVNIIGIAYQDRQGYGSNENLNVWLPYSTVINRITGQTPLRSITVRVKDNIDMGSAEQAVTKLLIQRHGNKDFFIFNTDNIKQMIQSTTSTMTLLISMIALISLIVGGIGVMNIMLVSVTERTKEIGVRMAVGARSGDILQQFLIEAVLVCLIGGVLGILFALMIGLLFELFVSDFVMHFSITSIVIAFTCSSLIGVIFGFFPAKRAAKLDPIYALERE